MRTYAAPGERIHKAASADPETRVGSEAALTFDDVLLLPGPLEEGWRRKVATFAALILQDLAGRERAYVTPRSTHLAS
jgi:hypothetical protein